MAVNGTEIKVGQIWQTYGGKVVKVVAEDDHQDFPFDIEGGGIEYYVGRNGRSYGDLGCTDKHAADDDLKRRIADDAADYTLWSGGSNPVPGVRVAVILRNGDRPESASGDWRWAHYDNPTDLIAYKVVQEAVKPTVTLDAQEIAEPASAPQHSGGGKLTGDHYYRVVVTSPMSPELSPYTAECADIIEALNMTFNEGEAFKALWRLAAARQGRGKPGNKAQYDADKVAHYGQRVAAHTREQEKAK